ncbi:ABC transporter substrate-binding protein [Saccharibacillus qingshengii]|uniref:ABC transporter substrate-binding protein n=1 Tax=Saccharibacillus qingshengii TaxID=1763540 RepID=UPI0015565BED|nr:extracellular solute-binding protein [Saccharibacillus qingshengii]
MKRSLLKKAAIGSLSLGLMWVSSGLPMNGTALAESSSQSETSETIKVVYGSEASFQKEYGEAFSKKFPNTEFEVISPGAYGVTNYDQLIAKNSPDLIMLTPSDYQKLAKANKLTDLEPLMEQSDYDTASVYPGLIDELKKQGGGELYGLSKSVQAKALLYNADLFKKYNVELPKDGMTWEDILKLAAKFPTQGDKNSRIWGLSAFGSSNLAMDIARTEGLTPVDPETFKVTANTPIWKKIYNMAANATKSGALDERISLSAKSYLESSPFVTGRSAMTVSSITELKNLKAAQSSKKIKPFTLGITAGPADSDDRKSTGDFYTSDILAIPAKASNVDGAWDFIEYVTGDEYAKAYYGGKSVNNISLLSRMVDEYAGYPVDAFYQLKPNLDAHLNAQALSLKSTEMETYFRSILGKEITLLADQKKTADQAAQAVQKQAQATADKLAKNAK